MPKPFGSASAATRPMARPVPPSGAVETSIRPQARPDNLGQPTPTLRDRMSGFFPEQGSQEQYDMIMQLVQAGMSNAQASGSPLANLLAPIAGAAIAGRATRKRNDAQAGRSGEMVSAVLGDAADNPQVQGYLDVLNDPDAPAYLKSIAQSRLDAIINPRPARTARTTPRRTGGGRGTPTAQPVDGQRNRRLYGEYDIGGVLHGRDSYGNMVPYTGPDGQPVRATRGDEAAAPGSPPASVADELTALTQPAAPAPAPAAPVPPALDESDPLGILNIPPA